MSVGGRLPPPDPAKRASHAYSEDNSNSNNTNLENSSKQKHSDRDTTVITTYNNKR